MVMVEMWKLLLRSGWVGDDRESCTLLFFELRLEKLMNENWLFAGWWKNGSTRGPFPVMSCGK